MAVYSIQRKLTYQDLERFPDDGLRHEILDGVHVVSASPSPHHQWVSHNLILEIGGFVRTHGLGRLYHAPLDVLLAEHDVVEPDLFFIAKGREEIITEANVKGAPDLVIEILSPSTRSRDLGVKRRIYERSGVKEYWLFDAKRARAIVYRRRSAESSTFLPPLVLTAEANDRLTSPLLPGLEISLREILAR